MIDVRSVDGAMQVAVQSDLTIYTALELHGELRPWLEQPCAWQLDLADVSELDGAGLQLLLMLRQHLTTTGHHLTVTGRSPAVNEALTLCGLNAAFDDHVVA